MPTPDAPTPHDLTPLTTNALRKVARALKAAGWTPEEADRA